ncbi:MAG: isochorismatase family protein [Candidatus Latescibacteria bacterium]|nr:isochorismatase family protein [Candidatus Latescibacterota bacterium]
MSKTLHVKPRYYRWHVEPGVEWVEKNTNYAHLDWTIPLHQTALVLVDVWDRHYLKDTEARGEAVIHEKILPLIAACRKAGMQLIHAPSPPQAKAHPAWVRLASEEEMSPKRDTWPPSEFRGKSGDFKSYARPVEPRAPELVKLREDLALHPKVQPERDEAVIATGEELHRYCKQKGILFLFFLGFNTNACILWRDYGTMEMSRRGYEILILRDCGTGMESFETQDTLGQTRGAILFLEMFGQYSLTSEDLIAGLPK